MKHLAIWLLALAAFAVCLPSSSQAQTLVVKDAYSYETIGKATTGAMFFTIENDGDEIDRLVEASLPATLADRVEIHTHIAGDDGVMRMRQVPHVDIPAQDVVEFRPMGYHLMIFGLNRPLKTGEILPLSLTFEKLGALETEAQVLPMNKNSESSEEHDH